MAYRRQLTLSACVDSTTDTKMLKGWVGPDRVESVRLCRFGWVWLGWIRLGQTGWVQRVAFGRLGPTGRISGLGQDGSGSTGRVQWVGLDPTDSIRSEGLGRVGSSQVVYEGLGRVKWGWVGRKYLQVF